MEVLVGIIILIGQLAYEKYQMRDAAAYSKRVVKR